MTTFELIKQIPCSADAVFEELCHMERYVESMKNIERLMVLSRAEHMAQTRWDATLDGRKLTWTEEDVYDQDARRIEYRLIEGDFSEMTGNWQVEDTADGCTVTLNVSFAFGIPMLAMFVEPILKRKLEENSHMLLDGIETYLNTK